MPEQVEGREADTLPQDSAGPAGGIAGKAVRSFTWAAASLVGNRLFLFLSTLVLARLLTPRDFGVVAVGITLIAYLELGLDLGVGSSIVYEQERGAGPRVQAAFTLNLVIASLLTLIGFLTAPAVAAFFHIPGAVNLLRVLSLYFIIRGTGQIQDAILRRDLQFARRTAADVTAAIVRGGISIVLAFQGLGAWALVVGLLAGAVTETVAKWILVRFRPSLRFDRDATRTLLGFGLSVTGLKVLAVIGEDFDYLVVGNQLGPTDLGYYSMAYRLPELLIANVYWLFSTVAFPVYATARELGIDNFRAAMLRALRLTTLFGFSVGVGLAIAARDLIPFLFSPKWSTASAPMALISLAMGLSAVGYASGDIFPAIGKPGLLLKINAPLAALMLAGFVIAAPYGIVAVAAVHLLFNALYPLIRLAVANRLLQSNVKENLAAMRPGLLATLGIAALALPVRLLMAPGLPALLLTLSAGAVGGLVALALGARSALGELRDLAAQSLARSGSR